MRPAERPGADGAAIALECAGQRKGKQQNEEGIQLKSSAEMGVKQRGEGAGRAAAGTVDAEKLVDGAGGEVACREDCEQSAQQQRGGEQRVGERAAAGWRRPVQIQIAAPR